MANPPSASAAANATNSQTRCGRRGAEEFWRKFTCAPDKFPCGAVAGTDDVGLAMIGPYPWRRGGIVAGIRSYRGHAAWRSHDIARPTKNFGPIRTRQPKVKRTRHANRAGDRLAAGESVILAVAAGAHGCRP